MVNEILNDTIKFISPIKYYFLKPIKNNYYWVDYNKLKKFEKRKINHFSNYCSGKMTLIDAAYQLWHKGYTDIEGKKKLVISQTELKVAPIDRYLFLRRMFKPIWSWYTLFMRIITLNNPITELYSFIKTIAVDQIDLSQDVYIYDDYPTYSSEILKDNPKVTIVLPTLNRYKYLAKLFRDIEKQDYKNFEIIVVDQSKPFNNSFYNRFDIKVKVIHQKKKALWKARNTAIKNSLGEYILMLDDDSRIGTNWITEHLKCIDYFKAEISAGVSISMVGSPIPDHYSYFRWADQLDTGNVLIKRIVFEKCGLFDLQFEGMRMGDDDFGVRAYINGFKSINNPFASRQHLKVSHGGLRELGSWDGLRPVSWTRPRPIPSILYHFRRNWGNINTVLFLVKNIPLSLSNYSMKGKKFGYLVSIIIFTLCFPIIIIQVFRSWLIATHKLNEGSMIENYYIAKI